MLRIIKNIITSIAFIFIGIISGFILDDWEKNNQVMILGTQGSSYSKRISREYEYMDNEWKIMRDAGILHKYINKPGSSICDLDLPEGCGGCVSG
jgi:hypothetical protein